MESTRETAELLRDLERLGESACAGCSRRLCGHHALIALVMGFKDAPRCASCLARALERPLGEFLDQVLGLIDHRDCYRSGQAWADKRENLRGSSRPCLAEPAPAPASAAEPLGGEASAEWDAGAMGCGDLVLELRIRLAQVKPGGVLRVTARDAGAPEDLPAWCRLTGNVLVDMKPPLYSIRRKE